MDSIRAWETMISSVSGSSSSRRSGEEEKNGQITTLVLTQGENRASRDGTSLTFVGWELLSRMDVLVFGFRVGKDLGICEHGGAIDS